MIRIKAYTTGLRTGLKIAAKLLKTRSWLTPIWRDSTQIVYDVGQIITVDYVKKIWKLHRKMPRIHSEIQPNIRSQIYMPDRLPGAQISYLHKMITATSNLRWVTHQMIYTRKDLYTIVLGEICRLPMQLDKI